MGPESQWPQSLHTALGIMLNTPVPMYLLWGAAHLVFYNDAFRSCMSTGVSPVLGKGGREFFSEAWPIIEAAVDEIRRTGAGRQLKRQRLPFFRDAAEEVACNINLSPVFGIAGKVDGVLAICGDMTATNGSGQEDRDLLEFAIDAVELGTWDLNPETNRFTANSRLKEWFGLNPDDEIPLPLAVAVIHPDDRDRVQAAIATAMTPESGGEYEAEYTIINPQTGKERAVAAKGRAFFNDLGEAVRFNGTLEDITAHRMAQKDIAASRRLAEIAIKASGVGLFEFNLSNPEAGSYSPAFAQIVTGDPDLKDVSHEVFLKHLHPDDMPLRIAAMKRLHESGIFSYTPRLVWKDGSVHYIQVLGGGVYDNNKKLIGFSGTVKDITIQEEQSKALKAADERFNKAQRESEVMFRNVTDSSPAGLWLCDEQGTFTYVNKTLAEWTGAGYQTLLKDGFNSYIHDADLAGNKAAFSRAVETRTHYDTMFRLRRKNGELVWCRAAGDPYYHEDGSFGGYAGYCLDINELITGQEALAQSELRFRSLIEEAPLATCLFVGYDMKIEVANELMLQYWGKGHSAIGKPLMEAIPELEGQPFIDILHEVYTTGKTYEARAAQAFLMSDGALKEFYFDFTYKPLFNADGAVYGIMEMAADVTRQTLAKRKLDEAQNQLLSSFEQAPVAIATISREHLTFRMANTFYATLVGRTPEEIIDKPLLEALPELAGQGFDDLLRQVIDSGEAYTALEVSVNLVRQQQLETIYVDLTYQPLLDLEGEVTGVLVVATDVTQQVRIRKSVEKSEARFRALIEEAPVATCLFVGPEMIVEVINEPMIGYWGKDFSVVNKPLIEALPELEGQPFLDILADVYATGKTYSAEAARVDLVVDGQLGTYYFDFTYKPLLDEEGKVYAIIDVSIDVTAQVAALRELEASESKLRSVIAAAPAGIGLFIGRDLIIENPNQTFIDIVGKGPDIVGKPLREAMPELITEGQPFLKILDDVFTSGKMFQSFGSQVKILQHGVMTDNYYNISYTPLFNSEGEVYAILDIAIDVTEEIKARQKLEDAEAALRGAIELAELATWRLDVRTGSFQYSVRFVEWLGLDEPILPISEAYNPLPEEFREEVAAAIQQAVTPGSSGKYEYEHPIINRQTGQIRIIHAQGQVTYDENGKALELVGTAQDVTEQRSIRLSLERQVQERTEQLASINEELQSINEELAESNSQLQHSNEELAQYAYVASHDLQEPLRKIRMFSGMLDTQPELSAEHRVYTQKIVQSAERMSLLIKDLLNFSRLLHSDTLIQQVSLPDIVRSVVEDFELIIHEKHADIAIGKLPQIEGIALQMNQLFYNLIGNALKFNKPDTAPRIYIEAFKLSPEEAARHINKPFKEAQYYHISISDNGIGFDAKYAEQIFEVFKRLHGKETYQGSGIGLALCRRIVANHAGTLFAESVPDSGSIFHLILPDRQQ